MSPEKHIEIFESPGIVDEVIDAINPGLLRDGHIFIRPRKVHVDGFENTVSKCYCGGSNGYLQVKKLGGLGSVNLYRFNKDLSLLQGGRQEDLAVSDFAWLGKNDERLHLDCMTEQLNLLRDPEGGDLRLAPTSDWISGILFVEPGILEL